MFKLYINEHHLSVARISVKGGDRIEAAEMMVHSVDTMRLIGPPNTVPVIRSIFSNAKFLAADTTHEFFANEVRIYDLSFSLFKKQIIEELMNCF